MARAIASMAVPATRSVSTSIATPLVRIMGRSGASMSLVTDCFLYGLPATCGAPFGAIRGCQLTLCGRRGAILPRVGYRRHFPARTIDYRLADLIGDALRSNERGCGRACGGAAFS